MSSIKPKASTPRREMRPERINISTDVLVRNDIHAMEKGGSERAHNRGDARGAPFVIIAGIKYRPEKQYDEWLAGQIQVRNQPAQRRKRPLVAGA